MDVQRIDSLDDLRLDDFRNVRDAELVNRRGVVLCEGRLVVRMLLEGARCMPRAVLLTPLALESMEAALRQASLRGVTPPVYLLEQREMNRVVGFDIHRGCLASAERPADPGVPGILHAQGDEPSKIVLCESLTNHDNMGGIFRCAAAFGVHGIVLSPDCCDPLYRKSVRVSMGAALRLPYTRASSTLEAVRTLQGLGVRLVALTPGGSVTIGEASRMLGPARRVVVLIGAEGDGLSADTLAQADIRARIDMAAGIDSLNATNACAVALYALRDGCGPA